MRPRIDASGGDPSKVHVIRVEGGSPLTIAEDLAEIERAAVADGAKLLIIDPITAYLGDANSYKDADVRRVLTPLAEVAERLGAAVIIIRHLNKQGSGPALYRGGGSIAFAAAARVVLLVAKDPEHGNASIVVPVKMNNGRKPKGRRFEIVETPKGAPKLSWGEAVEYTADQLLGAELEPRRSALASAVEFLNGALADGPLPAQGLQDDANAAGISSATLRRAKAQVGVRSICRGVKGKVGIRQVLWSLRDGLSDGVEAEEERNLA